MKKFKVVFYREMQCSIEINALSEMGAAELFKEGIINHNNIEIVKNVEVIDEISTITEIDQPQAQLFQH